METPQFCGATCHTMRPEFAAYQNSPHSRAGMCRMSCGAGCNRLAHSKASGTRQLFETVLKTAPKPIPSALESNRLVPARETCENCHWPQNFGGVRLRVIQQVRRRRSEYQIGNRSPDAGWWKPALRNSRRALWSGSSHPFCGSRREAADHSVGRIQKFKHGRCPNFRYRRNTAEFGERASHIRDGMCGLS